MAKPTSYDLVQLNNDIDKLLKNTNKEEQLVQLKKIVPEFNHQLNN